MSGVLERTLGILELLAGRPEGLPLAEIVERLDCPKSGAHRLLADLATAGWVRRVGERGDYALTLRLAALGLADLAAVGVVDVAQPFLDRLAEASGELVRLSVWSDGRLTWVAKAQGARSGLRYDPDQGQEARLSCSAGGLAVLSRLGDDEALTAVARQGFGAPADYGPNAVTGPSGLLAALAEARARGWSLTVETFTPGMTAMAAPIVGPDGEPRGAVSIAGPCVRFSAERIAAVAPLLLAAAADLGRAADACPALRG
ncbi:MAG: IclR family transcriptional regulator [Siculibacillus sp.]|nr:IclR family transcriptional regulator [Siculibacillus sp.]